MQQVNREKPNTNKRKGAILPPTVAELDVLWSINRFHSHAYTLGEEQQYD